MGLTHSLISFKNSRLTLLTTVEKIKTFEYDIQLTQEKEAVGEQDCEMKIPHKTLKDMLLFVMKNLQHF
ncbi:hypothetical protein JOD29_001704 [Lysinibacillus composti]|uniref:Uncharacterized protein n=1 Tax=Lysinibacillus composti TaxID=720633 RepID=A0A3N9UQD4_9BACI|nr:hypothetical protein [Lysinibacillus composti]MBM7608459.1 hypothetical protein [Lysinibacillus composti]RQW74752.1 hypothetical protein EBB45_09110 [Lysinibacillus composti]